MARHYQQGLFVPINPEKYVGDVNHICYRSGWEKKFMIWADTNPGVLKWCSEEMAIPYYSQVDLKMHRYFPDFLIQVKNRQGDVIKYMIEIKPLAQTKPPKKPSRNSKRFLNEMMTYSVNSSKWEAAEAYCKKNGLVFKIMTELDILPT